MKSPYLLLLIFLSLLNHCRSQEFIKPRPLISSSTKDDNSLKEFRPSHRLISFEEEELKESETATSTTNNQNHNVNSFNVSVAYPLNHNPSRKGETSDDTESDATFSHHQQIDAEGRTFLGTTGGWAGVGNEYCHNHHGYNSACCSLGYSNCCSNSNTFHKKPNFHGSGVGWFASGGGIGFQYNNHHHTKYPVVNHHHPHTHRPLPPHPPHPPAPIRPVLPVVPIRPHHPPPIYHNRPIIPHQPPPYHHGGWGVGGRVDKPGSCKPTTSSLLNKLNFFSKAKDIFGKGDSHHGIKESFKGSNGWGWEPPSHNGGWHFYRRSDISFPSSTPFITKRQVFEGREGDLTSHLNHQHNLGNNVIVISRNKLHQDKDIFNHNHHDNDNNAIFQRAQSPNLSFFNHAKLFPFQHDNSKSGSHFNNQQQQQGRSFQQPYGYHQQNPHGMPKTVGIGSLSGRILGGWNSPQNHHHHHQCRIDYDCPGHDKCCEGICSAPSFFG